MVKDEGETGQFEWPREDGSKKTPIGRDAKVGSKLKTERSFEHYLTVSSNWAAFKRIDLTAFVKEVIWGQWGRKDFKSEPREGSTVVE